MNLSKSLRKIIIALLIPSFLLSACVQVSRPFEPWKAATPQSRLAQVETPETEPTPDSEATAVPQITLTSAPQQASQHPIRLFLTRKNVLRISSIRSKRVITWARLPQNIAFRLIRLSARTRVSIWALSILIKKLSFRLTAKTHSRLISKSFQIQSWSTANP